MRTEPPTTSPPDDVLTDDRLDGVKRVDMSELKEIKVKVPVRLLMSLHFVKLTRTLSISQQVVEALEAFFADHPHIRSSAAGQTAPAHGAN